MATQLLTIPEAIKRLSISRSTLEREISDGEIAVCRVRGSVRIAESDLEAYVSRKRKYVDPRKVQWEPKSVVASGSPKKTGALRVLLDKELCARRRFK